MLTSKNAFRAVSAIFVSLALAACSDADSAQERSTPPPPKVSVVQVDRERIPVLNELPGRIAPTRIAEVRPQVSGVILERVFTQGSLVEKGDVLYRIDPRPFEVQVQSAEATLQRAKAVQKQAQQDADRQRSLAERGVNSRQQLDSSLAALAQANAEVAIAEAGLASAQLNLQYSEVTAPISGKIGRANVTEGALVSSTMQQALTTIRQLDPVYADFTQSANELLALRRALEAGELSTVASGEARLRLLYDDGTPYPQHGRLLFEEATVDESTGQITLRGEFPNPDGNLLPGMYVRVQIEQGVQEKAIAVPQQAVQRNASGTAQVYVVNGENVVELRPVQVARAFEDRWVIGEGLEEGDRVIVEGFQKIAPGATVVPEPWSLASAKDDATDSHGKGDTALAKSSDRAAD
ncbi:efflux RND transporter periplasmic adaptor subunit [Chelativorans sp. J32]|uniref:efflux RND transporter periplasmic adaptor subunit n=1 Tax=Chelativorans sp. J32 TaxID=935840 RepID=UPI0004B5DF53|nr:efflux RND transporter periplasmic adaptor subunit [Chelativorans sp. J32]